MPPVQVVSGPLDDALRRRLVYGGDILIFKDVAAMVELCDLTDGLIRETFDTSDPVRAQFELDREDYEDRFEALKNRYRKHEQAKRLFREALEEVGLSIGHTFWDRLHLRALPHDEGRTDGKIKRLGVHRDTWSSNVYAQTNWWAPIYPITAGRTIAFYPAYWTRPVKNTSASWDLEALRAERRGGAKPTVPLVPGPVDPVEQESELRVVIEPGDLLCFSGAHLHAGAPNSTGVARFSVEIRTVDVRDAASGAGAPNVDGDAPRTAMEWFYRVEDGTPLPKATARLKEQVLHE
ncbi:MAG: hypothetical protein WA990_03680 [Rubrobacteraceae bacterium]